MKLIRRDADGARVVTDAWVTVKDGDEVPPRGDVIVSLEQLATVSPDRDGRVGVRVAGDTDPEVLAKLIEGVTLIAVEFPKFTDGRGYSLARLLRDRYEYRGELRARGHVLRDQLFYMARCGFDTFVLVEGRSLEDGLTAFDDFSVTYQPAADHDKPIWRRR